MKPAVWIGAIVIAGAAGYWWYANRQAAETVVIPLPPAETAAPAAPAPATAPAPAPAATAPAATDVLGVENFDLAKVNDLIDASGLDPSRKTTLKAAVQQAAGNPEQLKTVLSEVATALGL